MQGCKRGVSVSFACVLAAVVVSSAMFTGQAQAATITIVNNDGGGEGFNDSTPVVPYTGSATLKR